VSIVATEASIVFDLDEQKKFRGFIDRLDKEGDTFIINDYKTNKHLPSESKEGYIDQLTLYGL
jgi:RecB family exonuclease